MKKTVKKPTKRKQPTAKNGKKPGEMPRTPALDRRQRYAEEYCRDWNGTQAAIRAGYSAKTAYSKANQLLKQVEVQEAIKKFKAESAQIARIDVTRYLKELDELVSFDPGECFQDGLARDVEDIPIEHRRSIKGIKVRTRILADGGAVTETDLALPDRAVGIREMGKYLGIGEEQLQQPITQINVQINFDGKPQ